VIHPSSTTTARLFMPAPVPMLGVDSKLRNNAHRRPSDSLQLLLTQQTALSASQLPPRLTALQAAPGATTLVPQQQLQSHQQLLVALGDAQHAEQTSSVGSLCLSARRCCFRRGRSPQATC